MTIYGIFVSKKSASQKRPVAALGAGTQIHPSVSVKSTKLEVEPKVSQSCGTPELLVARNDHLVVDTEDPPSAFR